MEKNYFELLDNTTDWFWEVNKEGRFTYSNKIVKEILGYEVEEILEISPFDLMDSHTKDTLQKLFDETLKTKKKVYNLSHKAIKKDGNSVFLELNALPIIVDDEVEGFRGISRNITQRVKQDIQKRFDFLSRILDYIPIPIFYKDKNGLYLGVNKAWNDMTGFTKEEILNKSVFDIAPKKIAQIYHEQDQKVFELEENPQIYEAEVYNKKQDKRYKVVFNKSAFFDKEGNLSGLIGTIIDKSDFTKLEEEKKENERLLIQHAKISAIGDMFENITHQWRQPLSLITTLTTGLIINEEHDLLEKDSLLESLEQINSTAQDLSKSLDFFRDYYSEDKSKLLTPLNSVIDKALEGIIQSFDGIKVEFVKNIENIEIYCFKQELLQIILSIFNNSIDQFKSEKIENGLIKIDIYKKDNYAIIQILDNGKGMDESLIKKVCLPYFSTKNKQKGAGLSLYMNRKIINEYMDGEFLLFNETWEYKEKTYKGICAKIMLPL